MRPAAPSSSCSRSCRRARAQKSVLWWAAKHRHHHLHSDTEQDVHSPRHKGFIYSHVGWIFARRHDATDLVKIADFARYPELMWLHKLRARAGRHARRASASSSPAGRAWWSASSGARSRSITPPSASTRSRTCAAASATSPATTPATTGCWRIFTMGEGWHNNHHAYQSSVRQGFRWWEIDPTFYILQARCPGSASCGT